MFKPRSIALFTSLSLALATVFLFQNCGSSGFDSQSSQGKLDLGVPEIHMPVPLPTLTNERDITANFEIRSSQPFIVKTATCTVDSLASADCSQLNFNLTDLSNGDHKLEISAESTSGVLVGPTSFVFRVDGTRPVVAFSTPPPAVSGRNVIVSFVATDNLSGVEKIECALDSGIFETCLSPVTLTNMTEGRHELQIRAVDFATNVSAIQRAVWKVDLTAPAVTLKSGPDAFTNSTSASVSFTGHDSVSPSVLFACSFDNGAFVRCTSPFAVENLKGGLHRIRVTGTDETGNVSAPSETTWTVDRVAPTKPLIVTDVASISESSTAQFSMSSEDLVSGISGFTCSIDDKPADNCQSPVVFEDLSAGRHKFVVNAVDGAGNISAGAVFNWQIKFPLDQTLAATYAGLVAAGREFSCAISLNKETKCWGRIGYHGAKELSPVVIANVVEAKKLSATNLNACAALSNGKVNCWGDNANGNLGSDTGSDTASGVEVPRVAAIASLDSSLSFSAPQNTHTCAVRNSGLITCWGDNSYGQLGSGNKEAQSGPVNVTFVDSVKSVATGYGTTCVVLRTGVVKCWGNLSTTRSTCTSTDSLTPVTADCLAPNKAVSFVIMPFGSFALFDDGNVYSIARGEVNLLERSSNTVAMTSGRDHLCLLFASGGMKCAGDNSAGQVGNGKRGGSVSQLVPVVGLTSGVVAISGGYDHTCAMMKTGGVKCWGTSRDGGLGAGADALSSNEPVDVVGF